MGLYLSSAAKPSVLRLWCAFVAFVADQADLKQFRNDTQSATKTFNDRFMEVTKHRLTAKKVEAPLLKKFHDLLEGLSQGGDADRGRIVQQATQTLQQLVRLFTTPRRKQSRKPRRKRSKKKAAELLEGKGGEVVLGKPQRDLLEQLVSLQEEHDKLQPNAERLLKQYLDSGDPAVDSQSVAELTRSWNHYAIESHGMEFRRGITEGACAFLKAARESADKLWWSVQQGVWLARACAPTGVRLWWVCSHGSACRCCVSEM